MPTLLIAALLTAANTAAAAAPGPPPGYPWLDAYDARQAIAARVPPPPGFERVETFPGSFAHWLTRLPLKPGVPPARLYNGGFKLYQHYHCGVLDMDVGTRDLQQCADVIMRFRAEFLFAAGRPGEIAFDYVSGSRVSFQDWLNRNGGGPAADAGHDRLRRYLIEVYARASTLSLAKELDPVPEVRGVQIGDVLVEGGAPGHAMLVTDLAVHPQTGERVFLLTQSHMPAQETQLMKNPYQPAISPWFSLERGEVLDTPDWTFRPHHLKRFPGVDTERPATHYSMRETQPIP